MGRGYAQATVGVTSLVGPFTRAELGYHPLGPLSLFAAAQVDRLGWSALGGVRVGW